MLKNEKYVLKSNERIAKNIYRMVLIGNTDCFSAPGQFVNILVDGFYLRRPISVCDYDEKSITLIYKVVGEGTKQMAKSLPGESFDVLAGLGNGFDVSKCDEHPLLVGGGVGTPPLYMLAKKLCEDGKTPTVVLGFASREDVFYEREFEALGAKVVLCTEDGSAGMKGFVTDGILEHAQECDFLFACGPMAMLKAVYDICDVKGQFSFEERMACGFGACMGCTCKTKYGNKRICRDGPVLEREEIVW